MASLSYKYASLIVNTSRREYYLIGIKYGDFLSIYVYK